MSSRTHVKWRSAILFFLMGLVAIVIISAFTGFWVITAIPVGFLFGFFLEKADLCGSSAFSEMIIMKDRQKFWGCVR